MNINCIIRDFFQPLAAMFLAPYLHPSGSLILTIFLFPSWPTDYVLKKTQHVFYLTKSDEKILILTDVSLVDEFFVNAGGHLL